MWNMGRRSGILGLCFGLALVVVAALQFVRGSAMAGIVLGGLGAYLIFNAAITTNWGGSD